MSFIKKIFPVIDTIRLYNGKLLTADLIAGLTVATVFIPQGMAYSLLAGMPPIYGLYAALAMIIYALFGTSRQLSIGPVAVSALLVLSGVSALADPGTSEYISLVITAGLLIGIVQIALSFLRLGFLVNFISHPVIAGFTSAAAVIILASQLKDALGIKMPRFEHTIDYFSYTYAHFGELNLITASIGIISIIVILGLKKIHKAIPGALIVVIIGTLISYFFNLESNGVEIIEEVPKGLPDFQIPILDIETIKSLIPVVLTVTTIGIVESISIAKVLESKHKDHSINPNQELFALGISKLLSAFFQSIPTSGSFTRSAINSNAGGKTTISSIITAILVALALLFLTPLFYYIPKAVLAAIILLAVFSLFDLKEAINLWKTHKRDFIMMLVTFVATLVFGIEEGVLFGVVLSIFAVLYQTSKPHFAIMGNIPNTEYYRNIERFPEAVESQETLILRFDDQLYYANSVYFKDKINAILKEEKYLNIKYLVLDGSSINNIDSTGIHTLRDIDEDLKERNIELHLCGATGPVRDILFKSNLMKEPEKHHMTVGDAIKELHLELISDKKINSIQTNVKPR